MSEYVAGLACNPPMTRRRLLCGLLASAVLACFAGWLVMSSGPRVTRKRFEQVKEGMTCGRTTGELFTRRCTALECVAPRQCVAKPS
jgi:hypothetical protein